MNRSVIANADNFSDIADIAVIDIIMVFDLHDLIPTPKFSVSENNFRFLCIRRIHLLTQALIQCVDSGFCLLPVWRKQCYVIDPVFLSFLQIEIDNEFSRIRESGRIDKLKIVPILQTHIPMADQLRVCRYAASRILAKHLVQPHNRDTPAGNHLTEHRAGSYRGQLVRIANQHHLGAIFHCFKQISGQINIQHGNLIYHYQICSKCFGAIIVSVLIRHQPESFMDG